MYLSTRVPSRSDVSPWRMTEALDQEIEEGSHFRHAMLSMRINRRQRHRLDDVRIREQRHQSAIGNRLADN